MSTHHFISKQRCVRCMSLFILVVFVSACQSRPTLEYPDGDKKKRVLVNAPKSTSEANADAVRRDK